MNLKELKNLTKKELTDIAQDKNLSFNSKYTKEQLIEIIQTSPKQKIKDKKPGKTQVEKPGKTQVEKPGKTQVEKPGKTQVEKTKNKVPDKQPAVRAEKGTKPLKKDELLLLKKEELIKLAKPWKLEISSKDTKVSIIEKLLKGSKATDPKKKVPPKKGKPNPKTKIENPSQDSYFDIVAENMLKLANLKLHSLSKEEEKTNFYQTYIPERYDEDKLVVMAKDPNTVYVYWDFSTETINKNEIDLNSKGLIRLYEIDDNEKRQMLKEAEIKISDLSTYIKIRNPNARLEAELIIHKNHKPLNLLLSNKVDVPAKYHPESREFPFAQGEQGGKTSSENYFPETISSFSVSSNNRNEIKEEKDELLLELKSDLIIYGSAKPGTIVTLGGNKVNLRPDGTFSIRLSFPDGMQEISIKGSLKGKSQKKEIKSYFSKKTENNTEWS